MTDEIQELGADELRARDAVRALSRPEADDAFRARLREGFVTGSIDSGPRETVLIQRGHRLAQSDERARQSDDKSAAHQKYVTCGENLHANCSIRSPAANRVSKHFQTFVFPPLLRGD